MSDTPAEPDTTIAELMARDPRKLTRADRTRIVDRLREGRAQFMLGQKTPKEAKDPAKAKAAPKPKVQLSLDDLDLD